MQFASNWELSQARAETVRQYLQVKWGIAAERLIAHGYADTQPLAPNNTEEGVARNRRTEFRIAGQQQLTVGLRCWWLFTALRQFADQQRGSVDVVSPEDQRPFYQFRVESAEQLDVEPVGYGN